MARPVIGITTGWAGPSPLREFARTSDVLYSDVLYVRQVEAGGGLPLLLPCLRDDTPLTELASRLDGLLITGGEDIHPLRYGVSAVHETCALSPTRDDFEFRFLPIFLKTNKPIFAICRGIQLINVLFGGTLIQDLPSETGALQHSQQPPFDCPVHEVRLVEGSRIREILGAGTVQVNSTHHQVVDRLGKELVAVGFSEEGFVEAVEHKNHRFLVAVQWHPERLGNSNGSHRALFSALVKAAAGKE